MVDVCPKAEACFGALERGLGVEGLLKAAGCLGALAGGPVEGCPNGCPKAGFAGREAAPRPVDGWPKVAAKAGFGGREAVPRPKGLGLLGCEEEPIGCEV